MTVEETVYGCSYEQGAEGAERRHQDEPCQQRCAGLVLRQVWGVSRKRMLEGCRWGGALSGPTPLVLQLGFPGAWADVWERERLECVGSLGLAGGTGGEDGRTLGGGAAALAGERTWEG